MDGNKGATTFRTAEMYCRRVQLLSKEKIAERYFRIAFECEEIAREARPGQFLMVRLLNPSWEYLLSRPFSFCTVEGRRIELFFEVVGKGTQSLSQAREGATLEVLGPLGNGFDFETVSRPVLVGGGMGIAPLPFLASELASKIRLQGITVLLGARTKSALCLRDDFARLGTTLRIATDDGTEGHKGPVTDLLERELESGRSDVPAVFACGPGPMLKAVAELTRNHDVPCQLSVEERMACGVGACMGCPCKTRDPSGDLHFKRVCVEGPVFDARELVFDEH
jgi:dihydroorotate dehydrogenase electron transfer subunit